MRFTSKISEKSRDYLRVFGGIMRKMELTQVLIFQRFRNFIDADSWIFG